MRRALLFSLPVLFLLGVLLTVSFTAEAQNGTNIVVQEGDTLDRIARRLNVSIGCITVANRISNPDLIYAGQVLFIPAVCPPYGGVFGPPQQNITPIATLSPTPFGFDPSQQGGGLTAEDAVPGEFIYVVQSGDVLDLIAAALNVDIDCLIDRNLLPRPAEIFPGNTIIIPNNCLPYDGLSSPGTLRAPVVEVGGDGAEATPPVSTATPTPSPTPTQAPEGTDTIPVPTEEQVDEDGIPVPTEEEVESAAPLLTPTLVGQGGGGIEQGDRQVIGSTGPTAMPTPVAASAETEEATVVVEATAEATEDTPVAAVTETEEAAAAVEATAEMTDMATEEAVETTMEATEDAEDTMAAAPIEGGEAAEAATEEALAVAVAAAGESVFTVTDSFDGTLNVAFPEAWTAAETEITQYMGIALDDGAGSTITVWAIPKSTITVIGQSAPINNLQATVAAVTGLEWGDPQRTEFDGRDAAFALSTDGSSLFYNIDSPDALIGMWVQTTPDALTLVRGDAEAALTSATYIPGE